MRVAQLQRVTMSNRRLFLFLLTAATAAGPTFTWAQAAAATPSVVTPKYRVVMQVSNGDPRGWNQALSNSLALTKNVGRGNVEIRIVAIGQGIGMLKVNSPATARIDAALAQGISVLACGETMKALQLEKGDLLPNVVIVPGGLIEVLDRQAEGWRYIKAD